MIAPKASEMRTAEYSSLEPPSQQSQTATRRRNTTLEVDLWLRPVDTKRSEGSCQSKRQPIPEVKHSAPSKSATHTGAQHDSLRNLWPFTVPAGPAVVLPQYGRLDDYSQLLDVQSAGFPLVCVQ